MKANSKSGWWVCTGALMKLIVASTVIAAEQPCDYDNNDEWPWLDNRTCQTQSPPLPLLSLLQSDDTPFATCSSSDADPDGDGWGWENNQSCVVPANAAGKYQPCSSAAADPDGDGWGWEYNRSCVVGTVKSTNVTPNYNVTNSNAPVCSSSSLDPDGDGWGWENHQSCVVIGGQTTTTSGIPQCVSANADPDGDDWGWENNQSCRVSAKTSPTSTAKIDANGNALCSDANADPDGDGWGWENGNNCRVGAAKKATTGVVFSEDFSAATAGKYSGKDLNATWGTPAWHLGFDQNRVNIVYDSADHGNAMRVTFPAGTYGSSGASAFLSDIQFGMDLPASYEELYLSYDIKFGKNFDFVLGGKLPGLCGHDSNRSPYNGCNTGGGFPTGYDGWSARGMWRVDGALENYVYHASQKNYYGDDELWNVKAIAGKWHTVQHRIVLNTVGQKNGIIEAWFDGQKVLSKRNIEFRKLPTIGINLFYFSTFYGGNDPSWAPSTDQYISYDNFAISTGPIVQETGFANDPTLAAANPDIANPESTTLKNTPSESTSGGSAGGGSMTLAQLFSLILIGLLAATRNPDARPTVKRLG